MDKWIQLQSENGEDNLYPIGKMDLLWVNSSTSSAFASQTISIDLSEYNMVYVTAGWSKSSANSYLGYVTLVGDRGIINGIGTTKIYREYQATTTGVVFGTGQYASAGGTSLSNNSDYAIPWRIYGIKLKTDDVR